MTVDLDNDLKEYRRDLAFRNKVIEECALVAECIKGHPDAPMYLLNKTIAAGIRALKDKP